MTETEPTGGPLEVPATARERTVEALGIHFARDHIGLAELERRMDRAYAARSRGELESLVSDLPDLPEHRAPVAAQAEPPAPAKKRELVVSVLAGSERRGRWTPPPRLLVTALMGGVVLDFREATFATDEVEVTVLSLMSGTEILVPPTLRVEVEGVPVLGAFRHRSEGASPTSDAPLLRVKGVTLMGGVEVRVLPPGETYRPDW